MTRRLRAAGLLAVLFVVVPTVGARAAEPISGYQTSGSGQVFTAFPTLPAFTVVEAPVEGTIALTSANLQAGGQAFARASILWPGDVLGGLGSLLAQAAPLPFPIPNYPVRAEAHEYTGPASDATIPGIRMQAFGSPTKSDALSDVGALVLPGLISIASAASHTTSVLTNDNASTTVDVSVHGINLDAGQVVIDTFKATSATVSDGVKPTAKATALVTGLVIGGVPATIDATGIHANGQGTPGLDPNAQIATVLGATGIHLALTSGDTKTDGATADATAPELIITIPTPGASALPAGFLTIVLGSTHAQTAASPGVAVNTDITDVGAPLGEVLGSSITGSDTGGSIPDLSAGGGSGLDAVSPGPSVTSPRSEVALNNASTSEPSDYHFGGISMRWVLIALLIGIVGVRLIRRYMRRLLSIGSQ